MFKKMKLRRQFRKEIDQKALYNEAVTWTKAYFKKRGIPHWTSEYQNTFSLHVSKYCLSYIHAYVKRRMKETLAAK
jgi:hypothetical protein